MRRPYLVLLALAVAGAAPDAPQATLRLQVLLDRAHFSPGEIDGEDGTNTRRALAAFQRERGLHSGASPDTATFLFAPTFRLSYVPAGLVIATVSPSTAPDTL